MSVCSLVALAGDEGEFLVFPGGHTGWITNAIFHGKSATFVDSLTSLKHSSVETLSQYKATAAVFDSILSSQYVKIEVLF